MLKEAHPDWGCQRISDMLLRGPALPASATAVERVLHEGYENVDLHTVAHEPKVNSFERARVNQLWQTARGVCERAHPAGARIGAVSPLSPTRPPVPLIFVHFQQPDRADRSAAPTLR
jgi:hypothetical protein